MQNHHKFAFLIRQKVLVCHLGNASCVRLRRCDNSIITRWPEFRKQRHRLCTPLLPFGVVVSTSGPSVLRYSTDLCTDKFLDFNGDKGFAGYVHWTNPITIYNISIKTKKVLSYYKCLKIIHESNLLFLSIDLYQFNL